jgi:hypothetical protein
MPDVTLGLGTADVSIAAETLGRNSGSLYGACPPRPHIVHSQVPRESLHEFLRAIEEAPDLSASPDNE